MLKRAFINLFFIAVCLGVQGQEPAEHGGHYYMVVPGPADWSSALKWCQQKGGYLAVVTDKEEGKFIERAITNSGPSIGNNGCWLGGFNRSPELAEDQWSWIDNTKLTYEHWAILEPKKPGNTLAMRTKSPDQGKWQALPRTTKLAFVCEWNRKPNLPKAGSKFENALADLRQGAPKEAATDGPGVEVEIPATLPPPARDLPAEATMEDLVRMLPTELHPDLIRQVKDRRKQDQLRKMQRAFYQKYAAGKTIKLTKVELVNNLATQRFKQEGLDFENFITSRVSAISYVFQPIYETGRIWGEEEPKTTHEFFKKYKNYDYIQARILSVNAPDSRVGFQVKVELDLDKVRPATQYYHYNYWGYKLVKKR